MKVQKLNFNKLKKLNNKGVTLKNVTLKDLTTFKLGGTCDYYLEIVTLECFIKVFNYLKDINVSIFVLGNGSNILISDKGYRGVIVKLKGDFERIESREDLLEAGSGVLLPKLYSYTLKNNLSGLEEGGLIPATIGGAVYMNAKTGDFLTANLVEYVVAYNYDKIIYLRNEDCNFSDKHSLFQDGQYVILRVGMRLKKSTKEEIEDKHHKAYVYRKENHPIEFPSAGCVYKKPKDLNISKMLDDLGIKGRRIGGAYVSPKHANFIINEDGSSSDVYKLMKEIEKDFYEKYKINLEREVILLGAFDED